MVRRPGGLAAPEAAGAVRGRTSSLITQAEDAGLARVAEKDRRTLGKLDKIISALEGTTENQIVVGGQVEDVDAAS
ncbi:hypothetical protein OG379_40805 (plasmid) [Streptomyces sp. NBC_01166]|uniref:hypothetical protein n=1 Tax=Streptomyces sp. NBC_01166 TaxID=2903755 RepID=UPI002F90B4AC|nr:hypothetical protein OG379_40805 [Streptomyces sp. NBC_01166]